MMQLVFVDETSDAKFKEYFGLSVAAINHVHYERIKNGFQSILRESYWDESIEFKGSYLFSATKGDASVDIDQRIDIAEKILDLNTAKTNARMNFHYFRQHKCTSVSREYLDSLPLLLEKALPPAAKGRGKDVVAVYCDYRNDLNAPEIQDVITPTLQKKGYSLLEEVAMPHSNFHTVGILYARYRGLPIITN